VSVQPQSVHQSTLYIENK